MLFLKQRLCSRCLVIFFSTLLTFGLLNSFMIQKELFCNRFSQSLICLMSDASLRFLCIFLKKSGNRMTDLSTNFIKTIASGELASELSFLTKCELQDGDLHGGAIGDLFLVVYLSKLWKLASDSSFFPNRNSLNNQTATKRL